MLSERVSARSNRSCDQLRRDLNSSRGLHEVGRSTQADGAMSLAIVTTREDQTDMARLNFRVPVELSRFIAPKGSVALDGVSLTVNEVKQDEFSVMIIPHTLEVTTLGALATDEAINLEIDLVARYIARLIERR